MDASGFQSLLAFYGTDRRPALPRVSGVEETADGRRERLWLDGVAGDSILAYLHLPNRAEPPYQRIVFVPGSGSFFFAPV